MINREHAEDTAHATHHDSKPHAGNSEADLAVVTAGHAGTGLEAEHNGHGHEGHVQTDAATTHHPHEKGEHSPDHQPGHQRLART